MDVLLDMDVLEAARRRVSWCFDHYDKVVSNWSGGKDSTVVLDLALKEARKRGRLPLDVTWVDQEAEWQGVVDMARKLAADPEIRFHWFQLPFVQSNATGFVTRLLRCWWPEDKAIWMREHEPGAITDGDDWLDMYERKGGVGKVFMADLLDFAHKRIAGNDTTVSLDGIRAEESPVRRMVQKLSSAMRCNVEACLEPDMAETVAGCWMPEFVPAIFDWHTVDVWKYIHDEQLDYCPLYDGMYRMGVPHRRMRISSFMHGDAANNSLRLVQVLEPETWERLVKRLPSTNDYKHIQYDEVEGVKDLPPAFRTWKQYRDYLLENIIDEQWIKERFEMMFAREERIHGDDPELYERHVKALVRGDHYGHTTRHANAIAGRDRNRERKEREEAEAAEESEAA